MSPEKTYTDREIDSFFKKLEGAINRVENKVDTGFKNVNSRLDITNGKVKKIIIAGAIILGLALGFGLGIGALQLTDLFEFV